MRRQMPLSVLVPLLSLFPVVPSRHSWSLGHAGSFQPCSRGGWAVLVLPSERLSCSFWPRKSCCVGSASRLPEDEGSCSTQSELCFMKDFWEREKEGSELCFIPACCLPLPALPKPTPLLWPQRVAWHCPCLTRADGVLTGFLM